MKWVLLFATISSYWETDVATAQQVFVAIDECPQHAPLDLDLECSTSVSLTCLYGENRCCDPNFDNPPVVECTCTPGTPLKCKCIDCVCSEPTPAPTMCCPNDCVCCSEAPSTSPSMDGCSVDADCPEFAPGIEQFCFSEDSQNCGILRTLISCVIPNNLGGIDLDNCINGQVCDDRREICADNPGTKQCHSPCLTDASCAPGDTCDTATGKCGPNPCQNDANCVDHFACNGFGGTCGRRTCTADPDCAADAGVCVKGICQGNLGECQPLRF